MAHSLPGLFSCEARLTAYLNDAQNVRTGIRNDSLLGLLLTDGDVCYGLKAVDRISFELKLHNRPLPYKSSRRGLGRRAGSAIPLWDHYMYRQGQICHPQKRTQCPLGPGITSGQTASAADPADIWRTYHDDAHKKASPPHRLGRFPANPVYARGGDVSLFH